MSIKKDESLEAFIFFFDYNSVERTALGNSRQL